MNRDAFLQRVRQAVRDGNRPGSATALEPRGGVGYQGANPDPITRFRDELTAAGGHAHIVPNRDAAVGTVISLIQGKSIRKALLGSGPVLSPLGLRERLAAIGIEVTAVDQLTPADGRETLFAADIGISGVDYLIAETGSVALLAKAGEPRSLSLLPPIHIAVADRSQLIPDLFDLFERVSPNNTPGNVPSCLTLITGPSKTGDIELRLVTGVHGPGEIHVVLIEA